MTEAAAEKAKGQSVDFGDRTEFFQIRGQVYTLLTLRVDEPDDHQFFMELHKEIGRAPDFFRHAPVVVDVGPVVERQPINLGEFGRRLRQLHLVPVGIQNGNESWNSMAVNAGFGLFPAGRPASGSKKRDPGSGEEVSNKSESRPPAETLAPPSQPAAAGATSQQAAGQGDVRNPSKIITEPVRAGQQVYAKNADLVALAQVQPGAELMADGNIHIYSSLRGRAHAGVGGDAGARIFCRSMEAQLISIGGIYLVNDEIEQEFLGQPVQIGCQNETIVMQRLP